jgi:hypothetical protein
MSLTITSDPMTMERNPSPAVKQPLPMLRRENRPQSLRLSPLAWLKLLLFLHAGETEVGFFGICAEDDLLYVQDLAVPKQKVSAVTVCFDDQSVADHFEDCADAGIQPSRCGRLWIHTHPGFSPNPSGVDEETFARVFGSCDWAVMAIVARGGATYARLSFSAGPGGDVMIPMAVDWEALPQEIQSREGSLDELFGGWLDEYGSRIFPEDWRPVAKSPSPQLGQSQPAFSDPRDTLDDLYDHMMLDQQFEDAYCDSILEGVYP